jgi:uncharacterized membrane protein (UPF0182 family)
MIKLISSFIFALIIAAFSLPALAIEYSCEVMRKLDREQDYTSKQIAKFRFSNRVEELNESSFVSRCSFTPSAGKVTCDRYKIDKVVFDENVKIKKYYRFESQFDFQLFPDLSFVENNGRGGVSYGQCMLVSP